MALCHITGTLFIPDGTEAANRRLQFQKLATDVVTDDYTGAVVPEVITTKTDANGDVDVYLITGYYIGSVFDRRGNRTYTFKATVPDQATANITDLISASDPILPLPAWLQQALDARDEAVDSASDASDDADRAEAAADLVDRRIYKTRAEAVAAIAGGFTLPDGSQFWAGDLMYVFRTGATAISDMPGVVPFGDIQAAHFGFSAPGSTAPNAASIVSALDYANGRTVTVNADVEYNCGTITYNVTNTSGVDLVFTGKGRKNNRVTGMLSIRSAYEAITAVTGLSIVSQTVLGFNGRYTKIDVANPSAFKRGDICRIVSDDLDPAARVGYTARLGGDVLVSHVDATSVYVGGIVEDYDKYLTNARLGVLPQSKVSIRGLKVQGGRDGQCLAVGPFYQPYVEAEFHDCIYNPVRFIGCIEGEFHIRSFFALPSSFDDLLYGALESSGARNKYVNLTAHGARHVFTTGFNSVGEGNPALELFGAPRDNRVINGYAWNSNNADWDDHEGARRTQFIGCYSAGAQRGGGASGSTAGGSAYALRGTDMLIINPTVMEGYAFAFFNSTAGVGNHKIIGGKSLCRMIGTDNTVSTPRGNVQIIGHTTEDTAPGNGPTAISAYYRLDISDCAIFRTNNSASTRVFQVQSGQVFVSNLKIVADFTGASGVRLFQVSGPGCVVDGDVGVSGVMTGGRAVHVDSTGVLTGNLSVRAESPVTMAVVDSGGSAIDLKWNLEVVESGQRVSITESRMSVAELPPATDNAGRREIVTNALSPAFGSAVVGGGSVTTPVYSNGTAWIVG